MFLSKVTMVSSPQTAQELAKLQDHGKRRIAFLGSRHVPVVDILLAYRVLLQS